MQNGVKQLVKYGVVGLIGLGVEWGFFFLFRDALGIVYWLSHAMGCTLAIINNFVLNYYFTFDAKSNFFRRAAIFFAIGLTGVVVGTTLLPIGVALIKEYCGSIINVENEKLVENISKLGATGVVVFVQFFLNKYVTFRQKEEQTTFDTEADN